MSDYIDSADSKVTGFGMITTARYEGFTERILSEFERILDKLSDSDKVNTVTDFYTKLYKHLQDPAGHDIGWINYKKDLISQLYRIYRELHYTGSSKEMIKSTIKGIEVGTDKDVSAGISNTKGMNVVQWKPIFDKHLESMAAHYRIYQTLNPDNAFRARPAYYLSLDQRYFDGNPANEQYTTPPIAWHNDEYTLEIRCKLLSTDKEILRIESGDNILTIKQEDYTFVSYLNGTKIAKLDTNEVLKKDHIVISYTRKETIFAANLDVTIANLPALDNAKLTITDSINPDGVYQLTYYPAAANDTEIRFLLN